MDHDDRAATGADEKSPEPWSAARALLLGLALLLPGATALAGSNIPGVDIKLGKNPGGSIMVSTATGADGAYQFEGLAPGSYELFVGGQRVQTISVGANRSISGVLSSEPGGKASISFNGQVGVVPDLPSYPITSITISLPANPDASKVAENDSPLPTTRGTTTSTPVNGVGGTGGGRLAVAGADDPNSDLQQVSTTTKGTTTSTPVNGIGGTGGGRFTFKPTRGAEPRTDGGAGELPGLQVQANQDAIPTAAGLRLINNSETDTATVESRNRDHIDQDAQVASKRSAATLNSSGAVIASESRNQQGGNPTGTAPRTGGGGTDGEKPGLATPGTPIVGIPIGLEGDPGSIKVSGTTDANGAFHFDKLPAGKYKLTLPGLPSQSLTVESDGIAGGKVMRGSDRTVGIFDRWGKSLRVSADASPTGSAPAPVGTDSKASAGAAPGAGSSIFDRWGNRSIAGGLGGGFGMGPGSGPMPPGISPVGPGPMSPGPMSPGAGSPMGPAGGAAGRR